MDEKRMKILNKILKKTCSLVDELELLYDAETNHLNEYETAGEVLQDLLLAHTDLIKAVGKLAEGKEMALLGAVQTTMQESLEALEKNS